MLNINQNKTLFETKTRFYLTAARVSSNVVAGVLDIINDAMDAVFDGDDSYDSQRELRGFLTESGVAHVVILGTSTLLSQARAAADQSRLAAV